MKSFTSLIVTYNSLGEIGNLLTDLAQHVPENPVIVIDNASQDGSADLISSEFSTVHLVRNQENVGYSCAVNQGVALCQTQYILLLNPDIRIPDPEVITDLLDCIDRRDRIALVAPLQLMEGAQGRRLNFTWSYFSLQGIKIYWQVCVQQKKPTTKSKKVPYLNAGCLMLQREAFIRVGMLNENYFLYGEEPDLCLKLKRYKYECHLLLNSSIIHYRERSIARIKPMKRMLIRLKGLGNILHAFICGWGSIYKDSLAKRGILKRPFPHIQP